MTQAHLLKQSIEMLLEKAGFSTVVQSITKCEKGGNNRTYQVATSAGLFAVKKYFRQIGDVRDRLTSEFAFLSYAKKVAPHCVPTPYCFNMEEGLALYEFIEGQAIHADSITEQDVAQASQFFCELNKSQNKVSALGLPSASEACFAIMEHINLIDARLVELKKIVPACAEDDLAMQYIHHLLDLWQMILKNMSNAADRLDFSVALDISQRCISPSDFGFHNALRLRDGSIRFLDFEYAGWDDPAKMTGDFFSQLAVPIPAKFFDQFTREVMTPFVRPEELIFRAKLLRYLYQVKWCCIALNIFLPIHLARRQFANPDLDVGEIKRTQLKKVEILIKNLEMINHDYN